MFSVDFLNGIRSREMAKLIALIPPASRVLEFGAGTGRQAALIASHGHDVVAIDLPTSGYSGHRLFPVMDYDGEHIPLPDQSVDVIFSSNVLEHVEKLPVIMAEFRRILRPGGFAIHAMPTPAWRFWTFAAGVPTAFVAMACAVHQLIRPPREESRTSSLLRNLKVAAGAILPIGHGTSWEGISELWTFSPKAWRKAFEKHGFTLIKEEPVGLFYTGHMLLGSRLSFEQREKLSRTLGSAAYLYMVR